MFIKISNQTIINKEANMETEKKDDLEEEEFDDKEELEDD